METLHLFCLRIMEPYLFNGIVLPERAQLSLQFTLEFSHVASGINGVARASIVLNQIAVWVESEHDWDVFDLRNVVKSIVQNHLAMVGYLGGYAYDCEIIRVVSPSREIDYVFGIDIPCLTELRKSVDMQDGLLKLMAKTSGPIGVFIHRCFNDLVSAMKNADDTGFYCYRAIESLRHHCAATHGLSNADKVTQWGKFREISGCEEQTLRAIKMAADPLRHGELSAASSADRVRLFLSTWDVVDRYLNCV